MPTPSNSSPDSANSATQSRLGIGASCCLALAALGFLLVPRHEFFNMTGEWFTVGWPFSTGSLKVGFVSVESPRGIHPHVSPLALLNVALWLGVFFGIRRTAGATLLPRSVAHAIIVLAFLTSAVWFAFGVFSVATSLAHSQ